MSKLIFGKAENGQFVPSNKKEAEEYFSSIEGKKIYGVFKRETHVRTETQSRALHKGCELIAKALNDGGQDMRKVLKQDIDIPWTTESVKKHLFKPIMKAMTGKTSTKDLEKVGEIDKLWEVLLRHLMQNKRLDEYIQFPHDKNKKYD